MTKIEWVRNKDGLQGKTWNPVTGCTKVSEGCKNCYAERMAKRLAGRYGYPKDDPFKVTLHLDRLGQPLRWRKPTTIFVCSMSDLFHEDVPFEFVDEVLYAVKRCPQHTFLLLTKRPKRMYEYVERVELVDWPLDNAWLGVTAENQEMADKRIPILLQMPAAKRFVSVEPMLGPVDLSYFLPKTPFKDCKEELKPWYNAHGPNWIIVGGETGPGARPMNPDWARGLRDQCQDANVPFFFKQWGEYSPWDAWDGDTAYMWSETKIDSHFFSDDNWVARVGRKRSGRLLDGKEWSEMPERV